MYLTKRQKQTLDYINEYLRAHGYAPTLEEIGAHFGLSSPATVYKHVQQLVAKGYLRKTRHQGRGIEIVDVGSRPSLEVPILGEFSAGRPVIATADNRNLELPARFGSSSPIYLLRVRGAALEEELLADGDLLIIEDRPTARDGETVFAVLHGTVTAIGRYYREPSHVRLQPIHAAREPLYVPERQFQVRGVIVGTLRDYVEETAAAAVADR